MSSEGSASQEQGVSITGISSLSRTGDFLILARLFQGISAAVLTPAALSLVLNAFNHEKGKNKALGIWGAMGGIGATGGLLIGGPVTEWLGWEWIFLSMFP